MQNWGAGHHHVRLLNEAGLIDAINLSEMSRAAWHPRRLTFKGHEFLAAARSDTIWKKAKEKLLSATGTLTLEGLKQVLPEMVKTLLQ